MVKPQMIRTTPVLLAIALTCCPAAAFAGTATTSPAGIAAAAADLANAATGRALWGREQYTQRPIASITKVMTAYVVITAGHIGRYVTVTRADERYLGCCIQSAG